MLRSITLEQVGAIGVGAHAFGGRLASGHVWIAGSALPRALLLDPALVDIDQVPGDVRAAHAGARLVAAVIGSHLRVYQRDGTERWFARARAVPGGYRFSAGGTRLWELIRRRRWQLRVRRASDGGVIAVAELPPPDRSLKAWTIAGAHPRLDALVVSSVGQHVSIELGDGGLEVRTLETDAFIDWLPSGRAFLGARFDGRLVVRGWPGGDALRVLPTDRLRSMVDDELAFHGRVLDEDRAVTDTAAGRLLLVDLGDPHADLIELRLRGDARPGRLAWLEVGTGGRILTGRTGDELLRIWDGAEALRAVPVRRVVHR